MFHLNIFKYSFTNSIYKGDNQNNPHAEENLFQRREPDNSQKRHDYSGGPSFDRPYDRKNSSLDYNNSSKIVDYGHGNKQGKIGTFQFPLNCKVT